MKAEEIARVCHEANRAYCTTQGDDSQAPWEDAADWQRSSAVECVEAALADPKQTPALSHEAWLAQKVATGWKYGAVKDAEKKEHPCLLPYDQLPKEQRLKDYLFLAIVRACTALDQPIAQPEQPTAKPIVLTGMEYVSTTPPVVQEP